MLNRYQCDGEVKPLDWHVAPSASIYYRIDTTAVKADLNVYSALARLAHLFSQSDCSLVLFTPVLACNLLILAHGRKNIVKVFLVNSYVTRLLHCQVNLQTDASICSVYAGLETEYSCTMLSRC